MARQGRLLVDGGIYHITSRGHNRYKLFHSLDDYTIYKKLIKDYKKKFIFDVFHYCPMPNHTHILLRVNKGDELPSIMQGINQSYANHYKKCYKLIGNLFQGRYKSVFVDNDEYLLECGRYIERNPLRAGIVTDLLDYHFSSYNFYANGRKDDIITPNPCYLELSNDPKERMKLYREYILKKRPYETIIDKGLKI
ncbi:MAG: transposase [Candidatus Omnitrophica bacterium]|nr:transposase [Candidatus Omnitrophota bacterium]